MPRTRRSHSNSWTCGGHDDVDRRRHRHPLQFDDEHGRHGRRHHRRRHQRRQLRLHGRVVVRRHDALYGEQLTVNYWHGVGLPRTGRPSPLAARRGPARETIGVPLGVGVSPDDTIAIYGAGRCSTRAQRPSSRSAAPAAPTSCRSVCKGRRRFPVDHPVCRHQLRHQRHRHQGQAQPVAAVDRHGQYGNRGPAPTQASNGFATAQDIGNLLASARARSP